jgi:hypothetical protein
VVGGLIPVFGFPSQKFDPSGRGLVVDGSWKTHNAAKVVRAVHGPTGCGGRFSQGGLEPLDEILGSALFVLVLENPWFLESPPGLKAVASVQDHRGRKRVGVQHGQCRINVRWKVGLLVGLADDIHIGPKARNSRSGFVTATLEVFFWV